MKKTISLVLVLALGLAAEVANADFTFGEPTNLGPPINSSYGEFDPSISANGLSLYFGSSRSGGSGFYDLYVTTRDSINDPWSQPANLGPEVNSSSYDVDPSLSMDELSLLFVSSRPGGSGNDDLWVMTRTTRDGLWSSPVNLGPVVNSPYSEQDPSLSTDGQELYFCSNRPDGHGNYDIWVTARRTTRQMTEVWSTPMNLGPPINTSYSEHSPTISADGLILIFCRGTSYLVADLWTTKRKSEDETWEEPVNLGPIVNILDSNLDPYISADGRWLFFNSSERPSNSASWDLWQAPILPIVDLNSDGIVDAKDMCIIVDHWGTDEPLCDIGPMPWGDGIVDVQDLIVLAEHLFEEVPPLE